RLAFYSPSLHYALPICLVVEAGGRPLGASRPQCALVELRLDERRQRRAAIGRQTESIEREREHLRRSRLEIQQQAQRVGEIDVGDRKSTRLNSSHVAIS